jgi:hypothetical protein
MIAAGIFAVIFILEIRCILKWPRGGATMMETTMNDDEHDKKATWLNWRWHSGPPTGYASPERKTRQITAASRT